MPGKALDKAYRELVKAAMSQANPTGTVEHEARRHPRFKLARGIVELPVTIQVSIEDVGLGGLALWSDFDFPPRTPLRVSVEHILAVDVEVVGSRFVEKDAAFMEAKYLLHCRFSDPRAAEEFVALLSRMEALDLSLKTR